MNISYVGEGNVVLLSGGGKCFTDIAARFVGSEKSLKDIIASPYDKNIIKNILNSGHYSCAEFDHFIFGIEGYSRVTEVQLVRKRLASYMIKSGRINKHGKRSFDIVLPQNIESLETNYEILPKNIIFSDEMTLEEYCLHNNIKLPSPLYLKYDTSFLLHLIENLYNYGVHEGLPEEELRYFKPQATSFRALVGLNSHALLDWFKIRCCRNSQSEIRDLANKMLKLCKEALPDLFEKAGASCVSLGYCPENNRQHNDCKEKIFTHDQILNLIKNNKANVVIQPLQQLYI